MADTIMLLVAKLKRLHKIAVTPSDVYDASDVCDNGVRLSGNPHATVGFNRVQDMTCFPSQHASL